MKTFFEEIDVWGKRLYSLGLAIGASGNISMRQDNSMHITATKTSLGFLKERDIVTVDLDTGNYQGTVLPSTELAIHRAIYNQTNNHVVIHAHPSLINGYFSQYESVMHITFESKFMIGAIPVIPQETPSVTNITPVIEALKQSSIVVLKNHGVIVVGQTGDDAMAILESLEETIRSFVVARICAKNSIDSLDSAMISTLSKRDDVSYAMFSYEHIAAIVKKVNEDSFIQEKGKALELTMNLSISMNSSSERYRFVFERGTILALDNSTDVQFAITASQEIWFLVFSGKLDPFVAVTQKKMFLEGNFGHLSKWYVPFTRLFAIFTEVPFYLSDSARNGSFNSPAEHA